MPVIRTIEDYKALMQAMTVPYLPISGTATRFYFVRHGESVGNKERIVAGQTFDVDLTEKGIEDAKIAGETLRSLQEIQGWTFDGVFSSPSVRAVKTVRLILSRCSTMMYDIQADPYLLEKHGGIFEGMPQGIEYMKSRIAEDEAVEKKIGFWEKFKYQHDPNDLLRESFHQVFERILAFLNEKNEKAEFQGKILLIGSHSGILKSLLMADAAFNHGKILDNHRFDVPNGSILGLEIDQGELRVFYVEGPKYRSKDKYQLPETSSSILSSCK